MSTNRQKRIIHTVALRELGWEKSLYRDVMHEHFGVRSSKQLTEAQAEDFIDVLNAAKSGGAGRDESVWERMERAEEVDWGWGKDKYEELAQRPAEWARPRQLRKIEATWRDAARDTGDDALFAFIERQTGETHPARLKADGAKAVLVALDDMKNKAADKDDETPDKGPSNGAEKQGFEGPDVPFQPLGTDRQLPVQPPRDMADRTQRERVLWHLRNVGPIDRIQAQRLWGVGRLAPRILELKKDGHRIEKKQKHINTRFGGETTIAEYILHEST